MHIRQLFAFIILFLSITACSNQGSNKEPVHISENLDTNKGTPLIKFDKQEHDFGKIFQGEKVTYIFKFKNIGSDNLIIKSAAASCGCTVPKFPRDPLAPGETGEIEVTFDSSGRFGKQTKTITVWTNCSDEQLKLKIKTEIVEL